jgi:uncharacterized repeat protein (TIGR02543 family)
MSAAAVVTAAALSSLLVLVPVGAFADSPASPTPSASSTAPASPTTPTPTTPTTPAPDPTMAPLATPAPTQVPAPAQAPTQTPAPAPQAPAVSYPTVASLAAAFANATPGEVITLSQDLTGTPSDPPIVVRADTAITLDLYSHTLRLTRTDDSAGIGVPEGSTLTIADQNPFAGKLGHLFVNANGGAGIGASGGQGSGFGSIVVSGAEINATSERAAGIGAVPNGGASGSVTVLNTPTNSSVTATSVSGGAGIGGAYDSSWNGTVTILGGSVQAQGGSGAAGIGGGVFSEMGKITIDGAYVIAAGGSGAPGIGGGQNPVGALPPISISNGSTVLSRGGAGGPAVGGSSKAPINVSVTNAELEMFGYDDAIDLSNAGSSLANTGGTLGIAYGTTLTIPADKVLVNNGGSIEVYGTIVNHGGIQSTNGGSVKYPERVTDHNTTIKWNANGGTTPIAQTGPILASSMSIAGIDAIPHPTRTGFTFQGWFTARTGGSQVTDSSDLGGDGPKTITVYARWTPQVDAGTPPAGGSPGDPSGGGGTGPAVSPGSSGSTGPRSQVAAGTSLASTGSDVTPWAWAGAGLLAIGAAIAAAAAIRRRRQTP